MHVFRTWVGCSDATIFWAGVPVVDGVVVLDTWIGTSPCSFRDLTEQLASIDGFDNFTSCACPQTELSSLFYCAHEFAIDANTVVCVLVLNTDDVFATKVHVKTCIAKYSNFFFFSYFGFNEFNDVRMINIQNNHLCCPTSCSTGLDGAC